MTYEEFLRAKMVAAPERGFVIEPDAIHSSVKPHQAAIVRWALRKGNAAIFAAFGLGKTFMQLEIARQIQAHAGGKFLICAPLGVRQEFMRDAAKLEMRISFVRRIEECTADGIYLTNYETIRDSKLDPRAFTGCSLDEAAILRGFGGTKTFREFMRVFENGQVRYKFVATATPSPNEYIELLAYAAFLDVMDVSQAKTRFFKRDSTKADNLTLHAHKEREFWLWVSSWAIFLQKPSDLGFSDNGYVLPEMKVIWHEIPSDHTQAGYETSGQGRLVRSTAVGVTHAAKEKKDSLGARIEKVTELVIHQRTIKGVPPHLLPSKQGAVSSAESSALPEGQGQSPGTLATMEARQSREIQSGPEGAPRAQSGKTTNAQPTMVPSQQRESASAGPRGEVETLRSDAGAILGDDGSAERAMPDLPLPPYDTAAENARVQNPEFRSSRRSRSRDQESARAALPEVQRGTGAFSRHAADSDNRGTIPAQFIIWCDRNDEQRAIDKTLDRLGISYSSLYGVMSIDERETSLEEWKDKKTTAFVSKPVMYGAGVNLQQCSTAIFVGIGFKFSEFLQAVKRIHRFLQEREVVIHLIYTEAEREIRKRLQEKWDNHNKLVAQMSEIIREYGLAINAMEQEFGRTLGVERTEIIGKNYAMVHNDAVLETAAMPENSAHLILSSIPFLTQYEYSPSYNDFGHSETNEQFWEQMDYLIPDLLRVLAPGRVCAIHVKDRIVPGGLTGWVSRPCMPFTPTRSAISADQALR